MLSDFISLVEVRLCEASAQSIAGRTAVGRCRTFMRLFVAGLGSLEYMLQLRCLAGPYSSFLATNWSDRVFPGRRGATATQLPSNSPWSS